MSERQTHTADECRGCKANGKALAALVMLLVDKLEGISLPGFDDDETAAMRQELKELT